MSLETLGRDIQYGVRGLARDRTFTFTTVATLSVALTLVTVVFAIFNAYVLRPYAVRDRTACTRSAGGLRMPAAARSAGATTRSCATGTIFSQR